MSNPRTDWMMRTEPEPGLNGRALSYPRGKVLGGCTAINGMIYMRGQAADYDHWRQLGNAGWGWDDVLPYFTQVRGQFPRRETDCTAPAANGRWRASGCAGTSSRPSATRPRRSASRAATTSTTATTRAPGFFEVNQRNGIRWTTAKAFLRPAAAPPEPPRRHRRAGRPASFSTAGARPACATGSAGRSCEASRRRRGDPRGRRDQFAQAARALRHRRSRRARPRTASPCGTRCRAWARTCRIICRSGRSFASRARAPSTSSPTAASARRRWRLSTRSSAPGRCRWRRASSGIFSRSDETVATPTSSTTSSRSRPTGSAIRCTASRR